MNRRGFLKGLVAVGIAAPAIVSFANIMPVRNRLITPADPNWSPLYFPDEWARLKVASLKDVSTEKLIRFTNEINREFIRENVYYARTRRSGGW